MKKIRIAIADDHPMVINGLKDMLATQSNIIIESTYLNGADLLKGLELSEPDVLLLDIRMPGESGIEIAPFILKQYPRVRILILTNFDNTLYVHTLLNAGVQGYLLKNTDQNTLVEAIQCIYNGGQFLKDDIRGKLEQYRKSLKRNTTSKVVLTPREKDILQLIAKEYSNQEIADHLSLSLRTVENYRLNLSLKLEAKNTAGLLLKAIELGILNY